MGEPLLVIEDLVVRFPAPGRRGRVVHAVRGVSFSLARGETLGLVGESGCGKSTVARAVFGLCRPVSGAIRFDGATLTALSRRAWRPLRRQMGLVPQDPYASLDPTLSVVRSVAEPLRAHGMGSRGERLARAAALLERVGLSAEDGACSPHALSGGQRQRVAIARAVATDPLLLVADEPVSALDASVRARVLGLLDGLRRERGLALLLISHDLPVVRAVCDRLVVMYLGRIVEEGPAEAVFAGPVHPYTQALVAATPVPDPEAAQDPEQVAVAGEPPSPTDLPPGCAYAPRCPLADTRCTDERPELTPRDDDRGVACWHR